MPVKSEGGTIVKRPEVLDEKDVPGTMLGSEHRINQIEDYLSPALRRQRPFHVWLYGSPGTGKTSTAKHLLHKMHRESGIRGIYVNCWQHDSFYSILDHIIAELRILRAEEQRTNRKLEKFQQHIKQEPFIIVLDEVDRPSSAERNSILYSLCNLSKVGLLNIANSCGPLFELDARVRSRLNPALVSFRPYTTEQLVSILTERAREALAEGSWDRKILYEIAEPAKGDARVALQTMNRAAWLAERDRARKITVSYVQEAASPTQELRREYQLKRLTADHQIMYRILKYQGEILSSDLRQLYLLECSSMKRRPIAERTFSEYINDLKSAGLARIERARVRGKVRLVKIVK